MVATAQCRFTAYWTRGPIRAWNATTFDWERETNEDLIILKRIKDSNNLTSNFINELSAYHKFSTCVSNVVHCFGISRCPSTRELIVVTSYAHDGDLRKFLSKNFGSFNWKQKIITLKDIASGLVTIHKAGLLHKDLHTGNILRNGSWTMISDLGLCWNNTSVAKDDKTIHGVLPYVAPEVLRGHTYTRAADVYSIGMIMYELWSGKQPFEEREFDVNLTLDICSGTRPEITSEIPDYYSLIMQACWNGDPKMRPTSRDLEKTFNAWIESISKRQLYCPEMNSTKRNADVNEKIKNDESATNSSIENTSSQPISPLSEVQHKTLEEQDKRHEILYQKYYNQRRIELAEQESKNKEIEPMNPMTWTGELKILADEIFGKSGIENKLEFVGPDSTREAYDKPDGIQGVVNDRLDGIMTVEIRPLRFFTKLLILLHLQNVSDL
ncbi:11050_t:CDS:2 [Funneliformis geosporum]|nr:11050_t:CDS:2 [Funneliformis geosporum]